MACLSSPSWSQTQTSGTQSITSTGYNKACQVVLSNSTLVGEEMCSLQVSMYSNNVPQTGTIQGGVWNSSGTLVWNGGTINTSQLTSSPTWYTFENPSGSRHTFQAGDRFGVYSDAVTSGGRIIVNTDDTNPTFDGQNSYFEVWSTTNSQWENYQSSYDLDLSFKIFEHDPSGGSGGSGEGGSGSSEGTAPLAGDGSVLDYVLKFRTVVPR